MSFIPTDIAKGFVGVTAPFPLLLMFLGVIVASFFAAAPGIGGLLLLSLLMPYAMTLDPFAFIALIFGAATVGNTANTFTSVLIGVPGGSGSQATILDGYPLAKMGQANRALGAAFFGSLVGAFIGALAFIISLPFFKPLVLSLGSPEFLMMCLLGLSAVAILGGKQPVRGLISATVGMAIALVGTDARTGIERFTFGISYLWDGVSLIIIAMGMFAVPEMVDIFRRKTSIAEMEPLKGGQLEGVKDVFRHWWLVVRSSIVGVWVGVLPGLGSSVADWFAYAHAMQTEKNTENFGKGDIRGVIAPESANNAKEGGDLDSNAAVRHSRRLVDGDHSDRHDGGRHPAGHCDPHASGAVHVRHDLDAGDRQHHGDAAVDGLHQAVLSKPAWCLTTT